MSNLGQSTFILLVSISGYKPLILSDCSISNDAEQINHLIGPSTGNERSHDPISLMSWDVVSECAFLSQ